MQTPLVPAHRPLPARMSTERLQEELHAEIRRRHLSQTAVSRDAGVGVIDLRRFLDEGKADRQVRQLLETWVRSSVEVHMPRKTPTYAAEEEALETILQTAQAPDETDVGETVVPVKVKRDTNRLVIVIKFDD